MKSKSCKPPDKSQKSITDLFGRTNTTAQVVVSGVIDDSLMNNCASGLNTQQNVISGGVQDGASDSSSYVLGSVSEVTGVSLVAEQVNVEDNDLDNAQTSLSWLNQKKYAWLSPFVSDITICMKGEDRKGRSTACGRFKENDICVCVPKVKPKWRDIVVYPENPLLSGSTSPESFSAVPTYFWIPELFFWKYMRHMPCVNCSPSESRVTYIGWNDCGPRRVISLGREFDVICMRYRCKTCSTEFTGCDKRALDQMPSFISAQLPAVVFPKSCLDLDMQMLIAAAVVKGIFFADVQKMYREVNDAHHWRQQDVYYSFACYSQKHPLVVHANHSGKIKPFGQSQDKNGWHQVVPTVQLLIKSYELFSTRNSQIQRASLMAITGRVLSADHTFKIAKIVKLDHQQLFGACYTIMNEFNMVMGYYFVNSKSIDELEQELALIAQRYEHTTIPGPQLMYVDNCCQDRAAYLSFFSTLKSPKRAILRELHFNGRVMHVTNEEQLVAGLELLQKETFVGLDAEWNKATQHGGKAGKVAVVQICSQSVCLVISLFAFPSFPAQLASYLGSDVVKAGSNIQGDAIRLQKHWGVEVRNVQELKDLFMAHQLPSYALESMCSQILKCQIAKEKSNLDKNWENIILTPEQLKYAVDDAYASFLLMQYHSNPLEEVEVISVTSESTLTDEFAESILLDAFHFIDRIRRKIPKPSVLVPRVDFVLHLFRDACPDFITDKVMRNHQNNLKHLRDGCLSDHLGVNLYFDIKSPSDELPKYRCARGTSGQEGFHKHFKASIAASTLTPALADGLSLDITNRWNYQIAKSLGLTDCDLSIDLNTMQHLHSLFTDNIEYFEYNPVKSAYWKFDIPMELEKFGCLRALPLVVEDDMEPTALEDLVVLDSLILPDVLKISKATVVERSISATSKTLPFPRNFKYKDETDLGLQVLNECMSDKLTVDLLRVTEEYNNRLQRLIKEDATLLGAKYNFKTVTHFQALISSLEKKLQGQDLLKGFEVQLKELQRALQSTKEFNFEYVSPRPSLPAAVESSSHQIRIPNNTIADEAGDQPALEFANLLMDDSVHVCAACKKPCKRMNPAGRFEYVDGHRNGFCPLVGRAPNAEEKKEKDTFRKRLKRSHVGV
ncbi:hypothetical protein MIR68_002244 [Amoeboaphelidium protococcarum]|nr:hypothetical protein MIR68_002244 [Amoeboaphelidium protococcarum]